jgi:hypothetical protein
MKTLRFAAVAIAIAGSVSAFATNARVESMGKSSMFIMDDISIFDNPANINLYPNFLIGELGRYDNLKVDPEPGENRDPLDSWFGGIFSLKVRENVALSIGGVLNRKDERLTKYFPNWIKNGNELYPAPEPVTNFDGFLGAKIDNKAFGLHIYIAHQDGQDGDMKVNDDAFVSALQLDGGFNIELTSDYSLEFAMGTARIQYGPEDRDFLDNHLFSAFSHARLFSKLPAIQGHLIPVASFSYMRAPSRDEMDVVGGIGVDAAFEKGFFWMGINSFYNVERAYSNWTKNSDGETIFDVSQDEWGTSRPRLWKFGGTINFGIERNVWWDWFMLRVGGQKTVAYASYNSAGGTGGEGPSILCSATNELNCSQNGNYFDTNPVSNGSRGDNIGFGFGINIEDKLKIDATVAEDVMFRNPFQGEGRLMSRIAATYSF